MTVRIIITLILIVALIQTYWSKPIPQINTIDPIQSREEVEFAFESQPITDPKENWSSFPIDPKERFLLFQFDDSTFVRVDKDGQSVHISGQSYQDSTLNRVLSKIFDFAAHLNKKVLCIVVNEQTEWIDYQDLAYFKNKPINRVIYKSGHPEMGIITYDSLKYYDLCYLDEMKGYIACKYE